MDTYVLPPKYLNILKSESRDQLSLAESFNDVRYILSGSL
jgi:hypothetical protein